MYQAHLTLPFKIGIYDSKIAEVRGLLNLTPQALSFEFQEEFLYGKGRSEVQTLQVALNEIASIELKDRWFWATLVIQTRSIVALEALPKSRQGRVALSIAWGDRKAATRFARILGQYLAQRDLVQLERELAEER